VHLSQAASGVGLDHKAPLPELGLLAALTKRLKLELNVVVDPGEASLAGPGEDLGQLHICPGQDRPAKPQVEGLQDPVGALKPGRRPDDLEGIVQGAKPSSNPLVDVQWQVAGSFEGAARVVGPYAEAADDTIDVEEQQRSWSRDEGRLVSARTPTMNRAQA
jgi:hypothetical protein